MSNNHPNRNWRSKWSVSTHDLTATHQPTGLVVQFQQAEGGKPGELDGRIPDGTPIAPDWVGGLPRLLSEAGDIMAEALRDEPKH